MKYEEMLELDKVTLVNTIVDLQKKLHNAYTIKKITQDKYNQIINKVNEMIKISEE